MNQHSDTIQILIDSEVGRDIPEEYLLAVANIAEECTFKKGMDIIREGSPSRDLYLVKKGVVSIKLSLPLIHFNEEVIAKMKENEVFGEFSLVTGKTRSASVKADTAVTLFRIDYDSLTDLLESNTHLGYLLMRNIAAIISNKIENNHKLTRKMMLGW
ncbi:Crp/Fnr family transcriptional regulator [Calditrichota bacterium]